VDESTGANAPTPAEVKPFIKLISGDIAANERNLSDLNRMLILTRNNLVLGAVALFLGAAATWAQPPVWPIGAFMVGLGGWTLISAFNKRTRARRELIITEAKLKTSRLKLDSLMTKD